jgi:hypothetical protein
LIYEPRKHRPIRTIMRVDLVREMDQALDERLGGHEDRHELMNEAVQQYLVELRTAGGNTGDAVAEPTAAEETAAIEEKPPAWVAVPDVEPITDLDQTAILLPDRQPVLVENEAAHVRRDPLLGLHNADVATIAALCHLAELTADAPVPVKVYYQEATDRARELAAALGPYERRHEAKLSALLPSNFAKAQAAARGYQAFALGHIAKEPSKDGKLDAWGPLYLWEVAGLINDGGEIKVGVTAAGWKLLEELDGLTFERPHSHEHARRFLSHLSKHAHPDLWGFRTLLDALARGIGRVELNTHFLGQWDWKETVARSVAQGYIARGREWGLVAPKLVERRYEMTTFGREIRKTLAGEQAKVQTTKTSKRRRRRAR